MTLHSLLLLSDSALPLGSFAFSSGLESYLAHVKASRSGRATGTTFSTTTRGGPTNNNNTAAATTTTTQHLLLPFLHHSLTNLSATTLPYLLAAHHHPTHLLALDDTLDAATPCTVARRASTSQGRALAALWTRSLRATAPSGPLKDAVDGYVASLAADIGGGGGGGGGGGVVGGLLAVRPQAHLPPLFGAVLRALDVSAPEAAYVYLLNHAKAVLSAAVRAGVLGPYQSQGFLASAELRSRVEGEVERWVERTRDWGVDEGVGACREGAMWRLLSEEVGVSCPPMDLWMGRHELLYSRIFNS